jgi:hypothetical protein
LDSAGVVPAVPLGAEFCTRQKRERVTTSSIIDVSLPQSTRTHRALSVFADVTLAILLALAFPLVLTAIGLSLVWLVRAAVAVVDLF